MEFARSAVRLMTPTSNIAGRSLFVYVSEIDDRGGSACHFLLLDYQE